MGTTTSAWMIEAIERMLRVRESERDESRRVPLVARLPIYEVCPRCNGNACQRCGGRGAIEVSQ